VLKVQMEKKLCQISQKFSSLSSDESFVRGSKLFQGEFSTHMGWLDKSLLSFMRYFYACAQCVAKVFGLCSFAGRMTYNRGDYTGRRNEPGRRDKINGYFLT